MKLNAAHGQGNNATILVQGTLDATELMSARGSLGAALRDGWTVGVIGAGLSAPEKLLSSGPYCFDLGTVIDCIGSHGEEAKFRRPRNGNLFTIKITARNYSFSPPLSGAAVQVVFSAGGLDRQDQVGSCKVSAGGKSVTCKK